MKGVIIKPTEKKRRSVTVKQETIEQNGKRIAEANLPLQGLFNSNAVGAISGERLLKLFANCEVVRYQAETLHRSSLESGGGFRLDIF